MSRTVLALGFVAGIVVGAASSWLLVQAPEPALVVDTRAGETAGSQRGSDLASPSATARSGEADCPDVDSATEALSAERGEVAGLKRKLSDRLDALQRSQHANPDTGGRGPYELAVCREALENLTPRTPPKRLHPRRDKDDSLDVDQLVDMGFPSEEVEWIQDVWAEAKMDKLYLSDMLSRGENPEPGESFVDIERQLRDDLGDDNYAAMLYSTNQMNAVGLQNVRENSAGYEAGLRGGRVIYSYEGQRVFRPMELQALIRQTPPGQVVAIEVVGNDGLERIFVDSLVGTSFNAVKWAPTAP